MEARAWKWISVAILVTGMVWPPDSHAQYVYRWTDADGNVQYTPSLPPEAANRPYDVLSPRGVVLERVTEPETVQQPEEEKELVPIYSEEEKEQISERLLMLRYSDEAQIEEAMQLELDQLKYDFHMLNGEHASMIESLRQQVHSAANRQRAGLDVDPAQVKQIEALRARLADNRARVAKLEATEEAIREEFREELERFREIRERDNPAG